MNIEYYNPEITRMELEEALENKEVGAAAIAEIMKRLEITMTVKWDKNYSEAIEVKFD